MYTLNRFQVNIFTIIIESFIFISLKVYTLMQTPTDFDPPKRGQHLNLIFAISDWFIENESTNVGVKFLFLIIIYQENSILVYGHQSHVLK